MKRVNASIIASGAFCIVGVGSPAHAQEYCVVCSEPAAMYRCALDNYRPGNAVNPQAICQTAMTRQGPHAACKIGQGITVLDCKGPLKRIDLAAAGQPVTDASAPPPKTDPQGEPKTIADMIKRAQQPAPAARAAPGPGATPRTTPAAQPESSADAWRCFSSFFTKCGAQ